MPGFTSPSSQPKSHVGKANRPKRTAEVQLDHHIPRDYPITDQFASHSIPSFAERKARTNPKYGFNSVPAQSPNARGAQPVPHEPNRGAGRQVGRSEDKSNADTATSNGTKLVHKEGKNPGLGQLLSSAMSGFGQRARGTFPGKIVSAFGGQKKPSRFQVGTNLRIGN